MHRRTTAVTLAAVTALLAAAATSRAAEPGPDRVFMWRVRSDTATVHLLGSIHAARPTLYPLDPAIQAAVDAARVVAFETDLGDLPSAAGEMLAAGTLEPGTRLPDLLSPETMAALEARLRASGLPVAGFDTMRPWLVALTLTSAELVRAGYGLESGIDQHLWRRAEDADVPRLALEPISDQIALFAELTPAESEAFLAMTLADLERLGPMLDELTERWQAGDAAHAADLLAESFEPFPRLYEAVVVERNRSWMPTIEELLAGRRDALVVVGALHLVGDHGLVEMLRDRGHDVRQVAAGDGRRGGD